MIMRASICCGLRGLEKQGALIYSEVLKYGEFLPHGDFPLSLARLTFHSIKFDQFRSIFSLC